MVKRLVALGATGLVRIGFWLLGGGDGDVEAEGLELAEVARILRSRSALESYQPGPRSVNRAEGSASRC
jgi:hypothetical protein